MSTIPDRISAVIAGIFALSLNALLGTTAHAQTWGHYDGMGTYRVLDYAVTAEGEHLIATDGAGILRSSDHGASWMPMNAGLRLGAATFLYRHSSGRLFASVTLNRNQYVVTTASLLYRWNDSSREWVSVPFPVNYGPICIAEDARGRMYACYGSKQLFRSDDIGSTWRLISTFDSVVTPLYDGVNRVTRVAVDPDGSLVAGISGGAYSTLVLRSHDEGVTWRQMNAYSPGGTFRWIADPVTAFAFARNGALVVCTYDYYSNLYVTRNDGNVWTEPSFSHGSPMRSIVSSNAGNMFVGTTPGIYCSTDNGQTWNTVDSTISGAMLTMARDMSGTISAFGNNRVYWSPNGGAIWERSKLGVLEGMAELISHADIRAITSSPNDQIGTLLAGTSGNGALLSRNHGRTWRWLHPALPLDTVTHVGACGYQIQYAAGPEGLYVSRDTGFSWQRTAAVTTAERVTALAVGRNGTTVVVVGDSTILRSADTGTTWTQIDSGPLQPPFAQLALTRGDTLLIVTNDRVYTSTDFGDHFAPIGPAMPRTAVTAVAFAGGRKIFLGTPDGLLAAQPDDDTWHPAGEEVAHLAIYALSVNRYNAVLVGTDSGLYATGDFGAHWRLWANGMTNRHIRAINVNAIAETVFAGTLGGGIYDARYFAFAVNDEAPSIPAGALVAVAPNPAGTSATFTVDIPEHAHARLTLYTLSGQEVAVVTDQTLEPGPHSIVWDCSGMSRGTYLYRLVAGTETVSGRVVVR